MNILPYNNALLPSAEVKRKTVGNVIYEGADPVYVPFQANPTMPVMWRKCYKGVPYRRIGTVG